MSMKGDIIIPIMGPTGAGKSTFINALVGNDAVTVGHQLASCTAKIQCVIVTYKKKRVVLVDTPGFDDSKVDDSAILKLIADWLTKEYGADKKLTGIIYMHEITQTRMYGSARKNLAMFGKLCGKDAVRKVVLVTTKWGLVDSDSKAVAEKREKQLMETYWRYMLNLGSRMARFDLSAASGWAIVDKISAQPELPVDVLLIQQEMVDLEKKLQETEAGKALYTSMKDLVERMRQDSAGDEEVTAKRIAEIQKELADMKISLGRRFVLWITGKSRASKVVEVYDG